MAAAHFGFGLTRAATFFVEPGGAMACVQGECCLPAAWPRPRALALGLGACAPLGLDSVQLACEPRAPRLLALAREAQRTT